MMLFSLTTGMRYELNLVSPTTFLSSVAFKTLEARGDSELPHSVQRASPKAGSSSLLIGSTVYYRIYVLKYRSQHQKISSMHS